jgi:hypothetical protein
MKREIKHPYWANTEKTQVICQFHYEDGRILEASVMDTEEGNPDWAEIMDTFGVEGIDKATEDFGNERREAKEQQEARAKEAAEREKNDALFNIKLEVFEIPEIKDSTDREMKSRIRKAKTLTEVQIFASVLMMKELDNGATE